MALFGARREDDRAARDLQSAITKRDDLDRRLKSAETRVVECRDAAHTLARDGADDKALDVAEAALRAAQDRVATLTVALGDLRKDVAGLEAVINAANDKRERAATAAAIERIALDLVEAGKTFDEAAARLAAAARRASDIVLDANGLTAYALNAAAEVPAAISMINDVLRHRAVLVINGSAPAALPQPEKPQTRPVLVEAPKLERVFAIRHLRFTDSDGIIRRAPKMHAVDLKPEHASRAISRALAIRIDDPRVKQLSGTFGAQLPNLSWCVNLDSDEAATDAPVDTTPSSTAPIRHSMFEPLDRGKPFTLRVPVTPVEPVAVGQRTQSSSDAES